MLKIDNMRKLLFSSHNRKSIDWAALFLRLGFGLLMIPQHGWMKLKNFDVLKTEFMDFMGLGSATTLCLVIFAELFCSILLVLGLFTRLASIPLIITTIVIMNTHHWELVGKPELGTAYFIAYVTILFLGPGKYSLDGLIVKNTSRR